MPFHSLRFVFSKNHLQLRKRRHREACDVERSTISLCEVVLVGRDEGAMDKAWRGVSEGSERDAAVRFLGHYTADFLVIE